jgi:hypothetical protein
MRPRKATPIMCVVIFDGLFASCSNPGHTPIAPRNITSAGIGALNALSDSNLGLTGMSVLDARQDADGQWLYDTGVYLHASPVDVTVRKVEVHLYAYSTLLQQKNFSRIFHLRLLATCRCQFASRRFRTWRPS